MDVPLIDCDPRRSPGRRVKSDLLPLAAVSRSLKAHILLVLVTFVWGATFVQIKDALRDISPFMFNAVRMTLAAAALLLIYRKQVIQMSRGALVNAAMVGGFLWLGYEFQTSGLALTTPSKSAFITGFSVMLVPVFLVLVFGKRVNLVTIAGVAVSFLGLYLMTVPAGEGTSLASINRGDLLTVVSAVFFALQIITMGRAMQHHRFEAVSTLQIAIAAGLMLIIAPLAEHVRVIWSARVIAAILVTGLLGTAAAFSIQAWAQQFIPPTHTALIFLLEPVFAWITSFVFGERLGWRAGLGAVLILAGIVTAELISPSAEMKAELGSDVG